MHRFDPWSRDLELVRQLVAQHGIRGVIRLLVEVQRGVTPPRDDASREET